MYYAVLYACYILGRLIMINCWKHQNQPCFVCLKLTKKYLLLLRSKLLLYSTPKILQMYVVQSWGLRPRSY